LAITLSPSPSKFSSRRKRRLGVFLIVLIGFAFRIVLVAPQRRQFGGHVLGNRQRMGA
jgi:hypothetical protein